MRTQSLLPFRARTLGSLNLRVALLGALLAALLVALQAPRPASSAEPAATGRSMATAAASCWEIRKTDPTAPSGTYWLWTPALMAPQQFHCDMERAGGGWVLIGRGRQGWQTTYNGVGTSDELLGPRTGFETTQLPARTIDGLLGGRRVSGLREGIRVRRAMDSQGQRWQEVRFTLPERGRWAWSFGAGHPLGSYSFDNGLRKVVGTRGTSRRFGSDDAFLRVITTSPENQKYEQGFAYGPDVTAGPDPDSHLWSRNPGQGYARPYAEVYIRPRLLTKDFTAIPAGGTRAITRMAVASTWASPIEWGVTGLVKQFDSEGHVEVQVLAEGDGRLYVGGNFSTVQRGPAASGGDRFEQPYLAAFDIQTGEYLPGFRTELNGEVQAIEVLPQGRLAIGGAFTKADGQPATGVTVVDAATGERLPGFTLALGADGGPAEVRDLELVGPHLYVSGAFSSARGSGGPSLPAGNAVRVSPTTGQVDTAWNPRFNGSVNDSTPSPDGERMYFAGFFTRTGGEPTRRVAAVSAAAGAALVSKRWQPRWSHPETDYQRAIAVGPKRIWAGGSQHSLFSFAARTFEDVTATITAGEGGDFQAISVAGGVTYAGCHCNAFAYQGADTFGPRITGWTQADKINWVGAWTSDGRYVAEFSPMMRSAAGAGVWATLVDSDGALWAGGDLRSVQTGQTTSQWVGSFVRFPMQDHVAPGRPTMPSAAVQDGDSVVVSWVGSTDTDTGAGTGTGTGTGSAVSYEVLRNDRVVAVTDGTSVVVPGEAGDSFFVRAVDRTGNRSASTSAVSAS